LPIPSAAALIGRQTVLIFTAYSPPL